MSDPIEFLPVVGTDIVTGPHSFRLLEAIGDGGYGSVFLALDREKRQWAVKIEKYKRSMLHIEVNVLKATNAAGCKHFCQMIAYGAQKPSYTFVVMTLLGKDLHHLRSEMPSKRFSLASTLRIGRQTIEALEELHNCGYISRDFKPGNLAPGKGRNRKTIFMYDFGLARRFVDKNGNLLPNRGEVGWRGTQRYGSLNAHMRLDLSRRDDIESWMYMLFEFIRGQLPWRMINDRAQVHQAKLSCRTEKGRQDLLNGLPSQFDEMLTLIDQWTFDSVPNYQQLKDFISEAQKANGLTGKEKFDWDEDTYSWTNTTVTPKRSPTAKDLIAYGTIED